MGKMYTLDKKLLTGTPDIRIGDKVYAVDDRNKTVEKVMELFGDEKNTGTHTGEIFRLAFGKDHAKEIEDMELSFSATVELLSLVLSAMTGEDVDLKDKSGSSEKSTEVV